MEKIECLLVYFERLNIALDVFVDDGMEIYGVVTLSLYVDYFEVKLLLDFDENADFLEDLAIYESFQNITNKYQIQFDILTFEDQLNP